VRRNELDGRLRDSVQLASRASLGLDRSPKVRDTHEASDAADAHECGVDLLFG
jgi:hypothetical protein